MSKAYEDTVYCAEGVYDALLSVRHSAHGTIDPEEIAEDCRLIQSAIQVYIDIEREERKVEYADFLLYDAQQMIGNVAELLTSAASLCALHDMYKASN